MNLDDMDNEQLDAALAQHPFPPVAPQAWNDQGREDTIAALYDEGLRAIVEMSKLAHVEVSADGGALVVTFPPAPGGLRRAVEDYDEAMALANAGSIGSGVEW